MQFTIVDGKGQKHETVAEPSVVPGLLITQELGWQDRGYKRPRWHVTHEGTTQKITGSAMPKRHARLIAGALGGLPIDWTLATKEEMYRAVNAIQDSTLKSWLVRSLRAD